MSNFPPPGYSEEASAVQGIRVFKPAPEQAVARPVVQFRCPQCNGEKAYSAANGSLTCTYCGYHEAVAVEIVGRAAEQFEFTVETLDRAAQGWGTERSEVVCQQCGAQIVVPPNAMTATCAFCGSGKVLQQRAPQDVLRPRFLIPFAIDGDGCRAAVQTWLGNSWLVSARLRQRAAVGDFRPIFLPYWTFETLATAQWRAEVGRTVTERRGDQTITRTVWHWESGEVVHRFNDVRIRGSERLSERLLTAIDNFDLNALSAYRPQLLAGTQAVAYETPLEPAWAAARSSMREQTRRLCEKQASTGKIRNFSMTLDFAEEAWRYILLPVYLTTYFFDNRPYQVVVNGQTGKVAGQRPADWRKIALIAAAPIVLALLLMLAAALADVAQLVPVALLLGVAGVILAIVLGIQGAQLDDD